MCVWTFKLKLSLRESWLSGYWFVAGSCWLASWIIGLGRAGFGLAGQVVNQRNWKEAELRCSSLALRWIEHVGWTTNEHTYSPSHISYTQARECKGRMIDIGGTIMSVVGLCQAFSLSSEKLNAKQRSALEDWPAVVPITRAVLTAGWDNSGTRFRTPTCDGIQRGCITMIKF